MVVKGFGVFRGEGSLVADSDLSKFNKDVVAHEVAHQWWGSSTVNSNQGNYWFVESLAEMSSAIYVERVYGKKRYIAKVADWRKNILENELFANVQSNYTEWAGESGFGSVQANIYNKGPYAFHMLRETFGDEKFYEFLKRLAQSLKGEEIVTRDIQQVMEEVYGGNMEWFFDQWIRGVGVPEYSCQLDEAEDRGRQVARRGDDQAEGRGREVQAAALGGVLPRRIRPTSTTSCLAFASLMSQTQHG